MYSFGYKERMRPSLAGAAAFVLLTASPAFSQSIQDHTYTSENIIAGATIYAARCAGCHGPNGDTVAGVDFRRGLFRRAVTDDDLVKAITAGTPASGMPSFAFPPDQMNRLIAYLRAGFDAAGPPVRLGDRARGRMHVEGKGQCLTCHRLNGRGARTAPDLSDVGALRAPSAIQRSLLDPTAGMFPINRPIRIVTRDGRTIRGRRLNEDTFTVQIVEDESGRLLSLEKSELREIELAKTSPMPAATTVLTADEIADVVAYLASQKGL
jgi:putative heme-binding domain-containing protein